MVTTGSVSSLGGLKVLAVVALIGWLPAGPAWAVIKPDADIGGQRGIYSVASAILVGKIGGIDAAAEMVDVRIEKDVSSAGVKGRGRPFEKTVRVNLSAAPELLRRAKDGAPVVIIVGRTKGGLLHLADECCTAEESPTGSPPTWTVTKVEPWPIFPGVTPALVMALEDIVAGKFTDLNGVPHWMFPRYRRVVTLKGKPAFLACGDVNGDKIPDVLGGLADGRVELHLATAGGYETAAFRDATQEWGLGGAKGKAGALRDIDGDGKAELLLDDVLYANDGKAFKPGLALTKLPAGAEILAVGLGDANGDGRRDAALVTRAGDLCVFENSGAADKPWKPLPARSLWKEDPKNPTQKAVFGEFGHDGNLYLMAVRFDGPVRYPVDPRDGFPRDMDGLALAFKGRSKPDLACVALTSLQTARRTGPSPKQGESVSDASLLIFTPEGNAKDLALMNRGHGVFLLNGRMGLFRHEDRKSVV